MLCLTDCKTLSHNEVHTWTWWRLGAEGGGRRGRVLCRRARTHTHTHSVTHTHTLFTNGDYALVPSLSHARTATTLSVAIPYPSQSWCRARGICGDIDIRRTMLNNVEQEVGVDPTATELITLLERAPGE